jgi:hypothetical protein
MKDKNSKAVPNDWNEFAAEIVRRFRFDERSLAPTFKIFGPSGQPIGIMAFAVEVDDDLASAINAAFETLRQHSAYQRLAVSK